MQDTSGARLPLWCSAYPSLASYNVRILLTRVLPGQDSFRKPRRSAVLGIQGSHKHPQAKGASKSVQFPSAPVLGGKEVRAGPSRRCFEGTFRAWFSMCQYLGGKHFGSGLVLSSCGPAALLVLLRFFGLLVVSRCGVVVVSCLSPGGLLVVSWSLSSWTQCPSGVLVVPSWSLVVSWWSPPMSALGYKFCMRTASRRLLSSGASNSVRNASRKRCLETDMATSSTCAFRRIPNHRRS